VGIAIHLVGPATTVALSRDAGTDTGIPVEYWHLMSWTNEDGAMTKAIFGVWILAGLTLAGCASGPDIVYKRAGVFLEKSDYVNSFAAAKDAIGLLRDNSFTSPGPFEEVEVTESSVTVRTFKTETSQSTGWSGLYRIGTTPFVMNNQDTEATESRDQVSIWLADIVEISAEHRLVYGSSAQNQSGWDVKRDAYVCQLKLKDGRYIPFLTTEENYAKRVAAGFSFLAGKPVTGDVDLPGAGCSLNDDSEIIAERVDGPFDKAGIPLGYAVSGFDGHGETGQELIDGLRRLAPGTHAIKYHEPGIPFGDTTQIFVESPITSAP
jgi:hypothetical protein